METEKKNILKYFKCKLCGEEKSLEYGSIEYILGNHSFDNGSKYYSCPNCGVLINPLQIDNWIIITGEKNGRQRTK